MSSAFVENEIAMTLGQLGQREFHDVDFAAFAAWKGPAIRTVLDIGANRGQSVASLHAALPEAHIHCFEANPMFFPVLDAVAQAMRGLCTVHPFGLGRASGKLTLFVPWVGQRPFLEESSTIRDYYDKPWVAEKFRERGGLELHEHEVEIRRGDEFGFEPQLVKIDVEGAEGDVIAGLAETLRHARPVLLVENSDWHRVTDSLREFGYQPYRWEVDDRRLVAFYGATTNSFYLLDEHLRGFGVGA